MSGKNNEDRYAVSAYRISDTDTTPSVFAIVADGVGGHKAGEIAADIAVDVITKIIADSDASLPQEVLKSAIVQASAAINAQSLSDDAQKGMGSTCACVWVIGDQLYTASVGDSRIYLKRNGNIRQLTTDHTWIQEAIEHGIIRPDQARGHPRAHIIRRYLGSKKPVEPDFRLRLSPLENDEQAIANQGMRLLPGDQLLFCSDGLTDLVDDEEIGAALQSGKLQESIDGLVSLANERGGHDNITIVTLEMPPAGIQTLIGPVADQKPKPAFRWVTCAGIGALVAVILLALAAVVWYTSRPEPTPTPLPSVTAPAVIVTTFVPTGTDAPTQTPSPLPSSTPIQATYTPWPTATQPSGASAGSPDTRVLSGYSP
jgi:protein phosphatase